MATLRDLAQQLTDAADALDRADTSEEVDGLLGDALTEIEKLYDGLSAARDVTKEWIDDPDNKATGEVLTRIYKALHSANEATEAGMDAADSLTYLLTGTADEITAMLHNLTSIGDRPVADVLVRVLMGATGDAVEQLRQAAIWLDAAASHEGP